MNKPMKDYIDTSRFAPKGSEQEVVDVYHCLEVQGEKAKIPIIRTWEHNHWE